MLAGSASAGPHPGKTLERLLGKQAKKGERVERTLPPKKARAIEALLTETYGPPATGRANNTIRSWDIPVDAPVVGQSPIVNVMLVMNPRGKTRIILDDRMAVGNQPGAVAATAPASPVIMRRGRRGLARNAQADTVE